MKSPARRVLLTAGVSALALLALRRRGVGVPQAEATPEKFEVVHTDEEWRQLLSPKQYVVLRRESTERPFSSPLNSEHRTGLFGCAGCALDLFSSRTKFESGTGWPSFWQPLENAVAERRDGSLVLARTEIHCRRCGGHLGHVFTDGPQPTGLRYCMNGIAMTFRPATA